MLEADPLTGEVRETELFCAKCEKWIKLSPKIKYQMVNWRQHVLRVHWQEREQPGAPDGEGAVPSNRVKEAERKIALVNDIQAKDFGPRRVACGVCGKDIVLEGTANYELGSWLEHKRICSPYVESHPSLSH